MGCKLVLGQAGLVFVVARGQSWEESVSAQQSKRQGDALVMAANQQVQGHRLDETRLQYDVTLRDSVRQYN